MSSKKRWKSLRKRDKSIPRWRDLSDSLKESLRAVDWLHAPTETITITEVRDPMPGEAPEVRDPMPGEGIEIGTPLIPVRSARYRDPRNLRVQTTSDDLIVTCGWY